MYKKFLLTIMCVLMIINSGCGKEEISAIDTANLYLNAGYRSDASVAENTILENEINSFVFNIDDRTRKELIYSGSKYQVLNQNELNELITAINKIRAKSKIHAEYMNIDNRNKDYAYIKVTVMLIDTDYVKNSIRKRLSEKIKKNEKDLPHTQQAESIYYIEAFKEVVDEVTKDDTFLTKESSYSMNFRYNKITNKWDLINPIENINIIINSSKYYKY